MLCVPRAFLKLKRGERAQLPALMSRLDELQREYQAVGTWRQYMENKATIRMDRRARQKGLLPDAEEGPEPEDPEEEAGPGVSQESREDSGGEPSSPGGQGEGAQGLSGALRSSGSSAGRPGGGSPTWGQSLARRRISGRAGGVGDAAADNGAEASSSSSSRGDRNDALPSNRAKQISEL